MRDSEQFITYIGEHYQELMKRFKSFCFNKNYPWDYDIFQSTILKCYNLIEKQGLKDLSPDGIENYFFKAFKVNTIREQEYAYIANRDDNYTSESLIDAYEDYKTKNEQTAQQKVLDDAFQDFTIKYIVDVVEQEFDTISSHLFRIKLFYGCTYKRLKELTKIKDCKQRILKINEWLRENINKKDLYELFDEYQQNMK